MDGGRDRGDALLNSIRRTCARLDLGKTTVFELIKTGKLEPVKIGRKTLVTEASLIRLAAQSRRPP